MNPILDLDAQRVALNGESGASCSALDGEEGTVHPQQPSVARSNSTPYASQRYPPDRLRDRAWLHEQYVHQRLGSHAIGRMVGRSPGTVVYHLRRHGVPIRDRREAARRTDSQVAYP